MLPLPILNVRLNACSEDWQQMTPTAQGRHCAHCNRTVLDFTTSTQTDLEAAFQTAPDGRVCGRFRQSQLKPTPQLRPKLRRFLVALVLVCGLGLTSSEAWAQVRQAARTAPSSVEHVFGGAEVMPVYKNGGAEGMLKFLNSHALYPLDHEKAGRVRVFVSFTISKKGQVQNVHLQKGLYDAFNEEAVRVVKLLGEFTPGMQNGHPIEVSYTVPVTFSLD